MNNDPRFQEPRRHRDDAEAGKSASLRNTLEKVHDGTVEAGTAVLFVDHLRLIEGIIKLPGLFVTQYLFFWNWKRIIDPNTWPVILAGLGVWAVGVLTIVLMVLYE